MSTSMLRWLSSHGMEWEGKAGIIDMFHIMMNLIEAFRSERNTTYPGPSFIKPDQCAPAWKSNYIHYNVWDEITYPFLNFNGATVEV